MANAKYDNLIPLLAAGRLNWPADRIQGILLEGATFDATDVRLSDVPGTIKGRVALPQRTIGPDGSFLSFPASFPGATGGVQYAVVVAKDDGLGNPLVLSFYNQTAAAGPLTITSDGTLTVRPSGATNTTPGVWVDF
jgi:hypothetical protein